MPKKSGSAKKRVSHGSGSTGVEKALIENLVALQRIMANLSGKFDSLATQISKLLELFEISAKALAEKNFSISGDKGSEKVVQKIDTLLEQNKLIARGLTLMHEINASPEQMQNRPSQQRMMPPHQTALPSQARPFNENSEYQKSIAINDTENTESPLPNSLKKLKPAAPSR